MLKAQETAFAVRSALESLELHFGSEMQLNFVAVDPDNIEKTFFVGMSSGKDLQEFVDWLKEQER